MVARGNSSPLHVSTNASTSSWHVTATNTANSYQAPFLYEWVEVDYGELPSYRGCHILRYAIDFPRHEVVVELEDPARMLGRRTIDLQLWDDMTRGTVHYRHARHLRERTEGTMLEKILKLYRTSMITGVRSPVPHLYGPPGCGKSTAVEQAAELLDVDLWTINVSRLSPLEVEGVQMPIDDNTALHMIPAAFWTRMKDGDILLLDEFLRGFPEVYNGLLDILTSRKVGAHKIPNVFIIAASNSTATYDKALEDRLLHLPVLDPRKGNNGESERIAKTIVSALGLEPTLFASTEMQDMLQAEVYPMYEMLDRMNKPMGQTAGSSPRKLIGQVMLREVQSRNMKQLITANNRLAQSRGHHQNILLLNGKDAPAGYEDRARAMLETPGKLTDIQLKNIRVNLDLIGLEAIKQEEQEKGDDESDTQFI